MKLRLSGCSAKAARYAVERWHYSRCLPTGKLVKYGVWEHGHFIGAVVFARGASPYLGTKLNVAQTELCELARVALAKHETHVSRIVAVALRLLRKSNPGLRVCISFADANRSHYGVIYQAGNWVYTGTSAPKKEYVGPDGKTYHDRQVTGSGLVKEFGVTRRCFKVSECKRISLLGKHRYVMPFDERMRKTVEAMRKPYPKRERAKHSGDAPAGPDGGERFNSDSRAPHRIDDGR